VQDLEAPVWSKMFLKALASWRYATHFYRFPLELRVADKFIQLRKPKRVSL
jgi:hypothetical protein